MRIVISQGSPFSVFLRQITQHDPLNISREDDIFLYRGGYGALVVAQIVDSLQNNNMCGWIFLRGACNGVSSSVK